ncbi:long-chain fatty acid transport protein 4-like [Hylaeus volcanicus]|uniref:long-chain fatty acid transport protein 4-like n=1 Tax=Hylaeus volcanicus TaxID=313075 RepID=UPI0023B8577B|nr:long-chain fatty acid transport protein 4-like [Hylaeus volcanicus]XP_053989461.1 long-chain fatty acid transport protein 4-like [Hylaeus volcanicus]
MSATISNIPGNNLGNGTNGICDKERDVEKGEHRSDAVGLPSSICSRPTSSSRTSTSAESRVELEDKPRNKPNTVSVEVELEAATNNEPIIGAGTEVTTTAKTRTRTGTGTETSEPSRWKAVGRLLRRLALVMTLLACTIAVLALIAMYGGLVSLVQLLVVVLVAYLVSGGRFRWFYVAFKTLPRDTMAVTGYLKLLWIIRGHERKDRSVADVFRQHVSRHPNKVCFICEDEEWTFQQVEDYSNKIATLFKTHGYRKGDVVAVLLENRVEFIAIWLGLSKLGIITPLINTNLRKTALLHSITVSKCQALIYGADFTDAISDISSSLDPKFVLYRFGNTPNGKTSKLNEKDLNALLADISPTPPVLQEKGCHNDKLLYIFTSGTTGLPKAAVITNARYMFIATGIFMMAQFKSTDRFYTPLPLYHTAAGAMTTGATLLHGATTVIRKKFSASAYFTDCIKYNCTVGQYIGEMCRYILAVPPKPEDKKHNIRLMFGNGLRPQIWPEFIERFNIPRVAEFYGATEGNANIVNTDNTVGAIGFVSRIIPSVYPISILKADADGEPIRNAKGLCQVCEPNEPGVFVGKIIPNMPSRAFLGYVDEKASQKKIVRDVFKKGDSAFISGDILIADEFGYLYFKDRTGDTFRWKGENVSTSEVEAIISNLVNYRDCVVYGVEVPGVEGKAGMAAIYDDNDTLDINKLSVNLKEHLPFYAIPRFIRVLTKIDLTGTFKLKKKDLLEEEYDPNKVQDKLYYLSDKSGYQLLTPDVYEQIKQRKIRF